MDTENPSGKPKPEDYQKGVEKAQAYITENKMLWPQAAQESVEDIRRRMSINAYPTQLLIDADGKIVELNARGDRLTKALEKLLGDKPPAAK